VTEHELLTPSQVARLFKVDAKTVTRWCRQGKLPHIRTPGGHRRIFASAVYARLRPNQEGEVHETRPEH